MVAVAMVVVKKAVVGTVAVVVEVAAMGMVEVERALEV